MPQRRSAYTSGMPMWTHRQTRASDAGSPVGQPDNQGTTLTDERPETSHGDGDHERFAHYVLKDKIVESAVTGTPIRALCGKVWIPNRDPKKFPVCPTCKEIYEGLPQGGGDGES
jgi:hypothetical protein